MQRVAICVAFLVATAPPAAHAQDSPRKSAKKHYQRGLELAKAGDLEGAIAELTAAHDAAPSKRKYTVALAKVHFDHGVQLYSAERYTQAKDRFSAAARLDPQPPYVFAWAQSERLRGRCENALRLYERAMEMNPSRKERDRIRKVGIEPCKKQLAESGTEIPPDDDPVVETRVVQPTPWHKNRLALGIGAAGAALVAIGAGYFVAAEVSQIKAWTTSNYEDYQNNFDNFESRRGNAGMFLLAGTIVIGAGAAYAFWPRKPRTETVVGAWHDGDAGWVALSGSF